MMIRLRKLAAVLLALLMMLSMTGCEELDYREAVQFYNAHRYEEASQILSQLGNYKESADLLTRCAYWPAVDTMVAGDYASALEQFQALGDFEDSAARVTECKYQLAMAAYTAGDFASAEPFFLDTPDYKQTNECIRQINWQKFFDAVAEKGAQAEGDPTLTLEQNGRVFQVIARSADIQELIFSVSAIKDMGYVFTDTFYFRVTRDSFQAAFSAESSFSMDFNGSQIGSRQTGAGTLDITTCTAQTPLVLESFGMTVTNNRGESTSSTDLADCRMAEDMAENYTALMQILPQFLSDSGVEIPLSQIGFSAM